MHETPLVSVVIPVFNQWPVTQRCLEALQSATDRVVHEVIVVDDASTDETSELLGTNTGITVVRNPRNLGFLASCNRGAAQAKGKYITFLNNDTEPRPGWLDEVIFVFRNFAEVGLVGSKLVYPDGRLQDAGGLIWSSGDPWNYGHGEDPDLSEFGYTRQADYVTGASMTIDRDVWRRVGGFSEEFSPAYFEDTDLAFKVRLVGRKVVYAPLSVVVHHEGVSSGTDTASGTKRYQAINEPLFKAKWMDAYAHHPDLGTDPRLAADHRGTRFRMLILAAEVPWVGDLAAGYEAVQEIRLFQSLGCKVVLAAEQHPPTEDVIMELRRIGTEVTSGQGGADMRVLLEQRGPELDLVYIAGLETASKALDDVRRLSPRAKVLVKLTDVDRLRLGAPRQRGPHWAAPQHDADVLLAYLYAMPLASRLLDPQTRQVSELPWVSDVREPLVPLADREGVIFVGDPDDPIDRSFVEFLGRHVMPLVRECSPSTSLRIHGPRWRSLLGSHLDKVGLVHAGSELSITEALLLGRVAVSPSSTSGFAWRRIKWALTCGVPQVMSPADSIGNAMHETLALVTADSPIEWATRILELCTDDTAWTTSSDAALRFAQDHFSFDRARRVMYDILASSGIAISDPSVDALVVAHSRPVWAL
jgi:GT2 family glycosyltransferase